MPASMFPRARPTKGPRKAKPRPTVHVFIWDATSDWRGIPTCSTCGGLRTDSVHDLRPTSEQAAEVDQRKLGEGGDA